MLPILFYDVLKMMETGFLGGSFCLVVHNEFSALILFMVCDRSLKEWMFSLLSSTLLPS